MQKRVSLNFVCAGVAATLLLWTSTGSAQVANDYCGTATEITSLPFSDVPNLALATGTESSQSWQSLACQDGSDGPHTVWYRYTATRPIRLYAYDVVSGFDPDQNVIIQASPVGCSEDGTTGAQCPFVMGPSACLDSIKCGGLWYWEDPLLQLSPAVGVPYWFKFAYGSVANPHQVRFSACGDAVIDNVYSVTEGCDDGNITTGDGCNDSCQVEPCWSCSGSPSVCTPLTGPTCGDDGNPCTEDVCAAGTCSHPARPDDTPGLTCADDGNTCTTEACVAGTCTHPAVADDTVCPNTNPCTTGATCQAGVCERLDDTCVAGVCGTSGPCVISQPLTLAYGAVIDLGGRDLHITGTGAVDGSGMTFGFENAATVTMDPNSALRTIVAGAARTLEIDSAGPCNLNGTIQANGIADAINESSGSGGTVRLNCGQINIGATAVIEATGEGLVVKDGEGGSFNSLGDPGMIFLDGGAGGITVSDGSALAATGDGTAGGTIDISTTGNCTIAGTVQADSQGMPVPQDLPDGGDGGTLAVACTNVTVSPTAEIIAGSEPNAKAGSLEISAAGDVSIAKGSRLTNNGEGYYAGTAIIAGGLCTLENSLKPSGYASTTSISCGSLNLTKYFKMKSKNADAATLQATIDGACTVAGDVSLKSTSEGEAGTVAIDCGGGLTQTKESKLDASTTGMGHMGQLQLTSAGELSIGGKIMVNAVYGGSDMQAVELRGVGVTMLNGSKLQSKYSTRPVHIFSKTPAGDAAGDISLGGKIDVRENNLTVEGCNVTLEEKGKISNNTMYPGLNKLIAHEALTINGKISAVGSDPNISSGGNELRYRTAAFVAKPEWIAPATSPVLDGTLSACQ